MTDTNNLNEVEQGIIKGLKQAIEYQKNEECKATKDGYHCNCSPFSTCCYCEANIDENIKEKQE